MATPDSYMMSKPLKSILDYCLFARDVSFKCSDMLPSLFYHSSRQPLPSRNPAVKAKLFSSVGLFPLRWPSPYLHSLQD